MSAAGCPDVLAETLRIMRERKCSQGEAMAEATRIVREWLRANGWAID